MVSLLRLGLQGLSRLIVLIIFCFGIPLYITLKYFYWLLPFMNNIVSLGILLFSTGIVGGLLILLFLTILGLAVEE